MNKLVDEIAWDLLRYMKKAAPYDRGNLSNNAVLRNKSAENAYEIHVDTDIAPYMKYTNESWDLFAPPLLGKVNPNERWFDNAVDSFVVQTCAANGWRLEICEFASSDNLWR